MGFWAAERIAVALMDQPARAGDMASRLRRVAGLDVDAGLAFVGNNVDVFTRLLRRFVQLHEQDVSEIVRQAKGADLSAVQQKAHSIKGGAATLGLMALASRAHQIEQAARDDGPHERLAELAAALQTDYATLSRHLARAAGSGAEP